MFCSKNLVIDPGEVIQNQIIFLYLALRFNFKKKKKKKKGGGRVLGDTEVQSFFFQVNALTT